MTTYLFLLCSLLRDSLSSRQRLVLENLALRQQLAVLSRRSPRPRVKAADRLFWSWLSRIWSGWRSALVLVQPETVIRWQRRAWRHYWAWRRRRARGRPRIPREVQDLIRRVAWENPHWGSMRIVGELRKLGCRISARTVRRYLREARRRPPSQSWRTFVRNHAPHIWAADFFTVQTLTLKTLYVFFFISHCRRKLVHLNVTAHPTAEWVWRQLGRLLREYVAHYNSARPHRSLGLETAAGPPAPAGPPEGARIVSRPVLGGLHHEYEWVAA